MKIMRLYTDKQNIWFASDFHLSHKQSFIWKARGFGSIESHSCFIIQDINKRVKEDDILFYLGDFSLNSSFEETLEYFNQIKCRNIYYIWGNHESIPAKIYRQEVAKKLQGIKELSIFDVEIYPLKWKNVTFLGHQAYVSIDKQPIVLSHFSFYTWDAMHHGVWNICGHSHSNCPEINPEDTEGLHLDVGVDNCLNLFNSACISFSELKELMKNKNIKLVDHHNPQTT